MTHYYTSDFYFFWVLFFFSTSHFLMPIFQEKFPFIQKSSRALVRYTYTKIMKQEKIAVWNIFFIYILYILKIYIYIVFHRSVMSTTFWEWPCTYHPLGETYSSWSLERCSSWMLVTQKVIQWKFQVLLSGKKNCNDKSLCVCDAFQVSASRTDIEDAEYIAMENLQAQHQKEEGLFDMVSTSNIFWSSRLYFICENVLLVSSFTIYSTHTHTEQLLGLIQELCFICFCFFAAVVSGWRHLSQATHAGRDSSPSGWEAGQSHGCVDGVCEGHLSCQW